MGKDICIVEKLDINFDEEHIIRCFAELPYSSILDSSLKSDDAGRYTIIAYDPFLLFESKGSMIKITKMKNNEVELISGNPLEILRKYLKKYQSACKYTDMPFVGGCIGYLSYDVANFIEVLPQNNMDDMSVSDIVFGFYNKVAVIDHKNIALYAIGASSGISGNKKAAAQQNLSDVRSIVGEILLAGQINNTQGCLNFGEYHCGPRSNFSKEGYMKIIERAREYIYNGDIFQVNLSQRFETEVHKEPSEIYLALRKCSPAPFSAYLNFGDVKIISSSPERFIKIKGNRIETKPIKGTRPRGENKNEDDILKNELAGSIKDRAELTMIVDLERNDLGKVCKIGSVVVEKHAEIEEYANVFHTVSTVAGELKEGVDIIDCVYATFPGGSITGAPKIRAMEIIEELEPVKRNVYTGSIGYMGFDGTADLNIAIRTIIVKEGRAYFSVGGGIVWDSDPEKEYIETLHKGRLMMEVLGRSNEV